MWGVSQLCSTMIVPIMVFVICLILKKQPTSKEAIYIILDPMPSIKVRNLGNDTYCEVSFVVLTIQPVSCNVYVGGKSNLSIYFYNIVFFNNIIIKVLK